MNKAIKVSDKARTKIFLDIIGLLCKASYSKHRLKQIAIEAEVSHGTLYNWMNATTTHPRIDTLLKVAGVLGYEIRLVKVGKQRLSLVK